MSVRFRRLIIEGLFTRVLCNLAKAWSCPVGLSWAFARECPQSRLYELKSVEGVVENVY